VRVGVPPKGERCHALAPGGHWKTTTFIAGLRVVAITAPMVIDGPMDKEAFLIYVREVLCPTLHPGDIVIADNLSRHKNDAVRAATKTVGATILYLPPYSPDFNPIEMVFSKLKALLKKAAHRTVEALWNKIGTLLATFSPTEVRGGSGNSDRVVSGSLASPTSPGGGKPKERGDEANETQSWGRLQSAGGPGRGQRR